MFDPEKREQIISSLSEALAMYEGHIPPQEYALEQLELILDEMEWD